MDANVQLSETRDFGRNGTGDEWYVDIWKYTAKTGTVGKTEREI